MHNGLEVAAGHFSAKGRKAENQDYCAARIPQDPLLSTKGIAAALADGISSSNVSQQASNAAVESFLADYYSTSEAWTTQNSGEQVLRAVNSWLFSHTQRSEYRFNKDKGYVCTFTAVVIKSGAAHVFHVGDSRVCRLRGDNLQCLTQEHRVANSTGGHYLQRALGVGPQLEIDYLQTDARPGDLYLLMTDGVHEFVSAQQIKSICTAHGTDPDKVACSLAEAALAAESPDNVTVQVLRVDSLPTPSISQTLQSSEALPFPPDLQPRSVFDGYRIERALYHSARSHVFLATDQETDQQVVIKTPAVDIRGDEAHLERFLLEEWIARRINSAHVLKPPERTRARSYFYIVTEFIEGQTLAQWMIDNPTPSIETVREIVQQIARGLQAFHRLEMLHQDLRPQNIMIDRTGTVKIIDFGSTRVAGLDELPQSANNLTILGTAQYTAPEYFLGEFGTPRSDQFSLAVVAYQMLSGKLPYGAQVVKARTRAMQRRLVYDSVLDDHRDIPAWVDYTLRKALDPDPLKRYDEISEFIHELSHPNTDFLNQARPPLIQRNPVAFWQLMCAILAGVIVLLVAGQ